MLGIILYYIIGIIAIFGAAAIHTMTADMRGYDVTKFWMEKNGSDIVCTNLPIIIGLTIWPVQLIRFVLNQDQYYQYYEKKE